jgi:hypothetical protein
MESLGVASTEPTGVEGVRYSELSRLEKWAVDRLTWTRPWSWSRPLLLFAFALYQSWRSEWSISSISIGLFILGAWALDSYMYDVGVNRLLHRCGVELGPEIVSPL